MVPNSYRPLAVHIVWHPRFAQGEPLAHTIYRHLCNDPVRSGARCAGVPVRFWSSKQQLLRVADQLPLYASHGAVVVLVDDEAVADDEWAAAVDKICTACKAAESRYRVFPVGLCEKAHKLSSRIADINFIQLQSVSEDAWPDVLLNPLIHELARLLLNRPRAGLEPSAAGPAPIRVFLSHAKHDGLDLAAGIRDHIAAHTQMGTFFDAHDIPPSTEWKQVLFEEAGNRQNALLILQTDAYSTREWCRIEVLQAKLGWVPALRVDAFETLERRGFPYVGNIPTVKWPPRTGRDPFETVLGLMLYEVLRASYFPRRVEALRNLYGVTQPLESIPYPPELLTVLRMQRILKKEPRTIFVYPDPPLGTEERMLLREMAPEVRMITATEIPSLA